MNCWQVLTPAPANMRKKMGREVMMGKLAKKAKQQEPIGTPAVSQPTHSKSRRIDPQSSEAEGCSRKSHSGDPLRCHAMGRQEWKMTLTSRALVRLRLSCPPRPFCGPSTRVAEESAIA